MNIDLLILINYMILVFIFLYLLMKLIFKIIKVVENKWKIKQLNKSDIRIILCVIIIFCLIIFVYDYTDFLKDVIRILNANSSLLSAIVAILNLIVVIKIFKINNYDTKLEKKYAKKSYWYRNLILDRKIEMIESEYDNFIDIIKNTDFFNDKDEYLQLQIDYLNGYRGKLFQNINDLIRIMDPYFAEILDIRLDDLQDMYTDELLELLAIENEKIQEKKEKVEEFKGKIIEHRNLFLEDLYQYESADYNFHKDEVF